MRETQSNAQKKTDSGGFGPYFQQNSLRSSTKDALFASLLVQHVAYTASNALNPAASAALCI